MGGGQSGERNLRELQVDPKAKEGIARSYPAAEPAKTHTNVSLLSSEMASLGPKTAHLASSAPLTPADAASGRRNLPAHPLFLPPKTSRPRPHETGRRAALALGGRIRRRVRRRGQRRGVLSPCRTGQGHAGDD